MLSRVGISDYSRPGEVLAPTVERVVSESSLMPYLSQRDSPPGAES
jgi:hypothetical protein